MPLLSRLRHRAREWVRGEGTEVNRTWKAFMQSRRVGVTALPLIDAAMRPPTFCLGSCFALEIKKGLKARGFPVAPWDVGLRIPLPEGGEFVSGGNHTVLYNTFVMRQEFEKAFGLWHQAEDDFWESRAADGSPVFRDPYRRSVLAGSREAVAEITRRLDAIMRDGILQSEFYVLTLGLTEVWLKQNDGRYANAHVGAPDGAITFSQSSYEENYANVKAIADLLFTRFPTRRMLLTVSPVPLKATFSGQDISIANTESKSILRAVAGRIARDYPANITYFPSYEICTMAEKFDTDQVYVPDGRHVQPAMVRRIVETFMTHHVS